MNLQRLIAARQRVLLVGPPGLGKTARIAAAAKSAQLDLVTMRASLSERVDFGGALVPDAKAGITRALPLEQLHQLQRTDKPTLLFLDDLGQAPIDVQAALMRLFDEGALSDQVLIWGATNRPGDKAGVTALCEPLRSRFHLAFTVAAPNTDDKADGGTLLGTWKEEVESWVDWAIDRQAAAEVIAYHRSTSGAYLYQWKPHADPSVRFPDFRSWETVVNLWSADIRDLSSISAAIGKPTAAHFLAFSELANECPTPDQVRMDPQGAPVPTKPGALYLVAAMLAQAAEPTDAGAFCTYLARMPRVYGALLGRDLHKRLGPRLAGQASWAKWFRENKSLFNL